MAETAPPPAPGGAGIGVWVPAPAGPGVSSRDSQRAGGRRARKECRGGTAPRCARGGGGRGLKRARPAAGFASPRG
eukprot:scaffold2261_cov405-Prasinococcus_capsulatus_cf.AAC.16